MHVGQVPPVSYHSPAPLNPIHEVRISRDSPGSDRSLVTSRVYERTRIYTLAVERETVQKKTFTKWANTYLRRFGIEVGDLFIDLRDGKILLKLLEILSGEPMPPPTLGRMRIHCLENVDKSLYFLSTLNVHLENVGAHDIVDGNARITLGLLWTIILRFQIQDIAISTTTVDGLGARSRLKRYSKDALLLWCQMKTAGYPNVDVQNFTTSWRDGLAFNALIHKHRPDLIRFGDLSPHTPLQNLESAFLVAEKRLGITRLFDPEDIYVEQPDEKSIITYVVTYYHYFSKAKADTVHARRVTNFLNYLQDVHEQACFYEKDTSALLAWIRRKIAWLDRRDFPPRVEELQQLLVEFNDYRLKEKPDKFVEKGNIEISLFTLQTKMRAVNMRVYKPENGLHVAQVNGAWQQLEKSEHARELALRDELVLQRRLEHLYSRFERKAKLREAWILDNQKLLQQPDYADDLLSVEAALKKHEALETDVCTYADRIQTVSKIAEELDRSNFYKTKEVLVTRDHIEKLWARLLSLMRERFARLDARHRHFKQFSELDHLSIIISSLQKLLETDDCGSHLSAVDDLLQRHELLETDIRSIHRSMSQSLRLLEGDSYATDPATELSKTREKAVRDAYSRLVATAEARRYALELSKTRWEVFAELDEQKYYIQERLNYMRAVHEIPNSGFVDSLFRRHRATEIELENRRIALNLTFEKASFLADQKFSDLPSVLDRVMEVKEAWEQLIEETVARKKTLMFVRDYQYFLVSCDDAESWIREKLELSASILQRGVQNDSLSLIEILLKRHQETIEAVDNFTSVVDQLKLNGKELLDQADDQLFASTDLRKAYTVADCRNRDQIRQNVDDKYRMITELYKQLSDEICHTQTALLDVLSLHQLFRMASTTYNWITEKRDYLRVYLIDELQDVHELARQADQPKYWSLMQEKMEAVKRRFVTLQMQMSKTAEQVSCINRLATGLLEGPRNDRNSLLNDESTVDRVVGMQDHLNLAWNRLADCMEAVRERILDDSTLIDLYNECKYASDWIKDKEDTIDTIDSLTIFPDSAAAAQGQIQLRILQGDLKAIEACIEDIGSRVDNAVSKGKQQEVSDKRPPPGLPQPLPRDFILRRHMDLIGRWNELQNAVKTRTAVFLTLDGADPATMEKLDTFQAWLNEIKTQLLSGECPHDLQETERRLLAQEHHMQEVDTYEPQVNSLISAVHALARSMDEVNRVALTQRINDVEEDWKAVKEAVVERGVALRQRYSLQYFFSEASLLEVLLNQQAAFLDRDELPTNLDPLRESLRQQEAFADTLNACSGRVGKLLDLGIKVAQENTASSVRVLTECEAVEKKYGQNCAKSEERTNLLRQRVQLHEFFNEVDDLEDWIADKKSALHATEISIKRHPQSALDKIRTIEEEIESSRDRGDRVIGLGKQLAQKYPVLDEEVKTRLEMLHNRWDDLLAMVRGLVQFVADESREKSMEDLMQKTQDWLDKKIKESLSPEVKQRTMQPLEASSLLVDLDLHEKNIRELVEYQAAVNQLNAEVQQDRPFTRQNEFRFSVKELKNKLDTVESHLSTERQRLDKLKSSSHAFAELMLEAVWAREKLLQLKQLPTPGTINAAQTTLLGQKLLELQRLRRQIRSHLLEAENRRPRMKRLCEDVEKVYCTEKYSELGVNTKRFQDTLCEIRGRWATLDLELERWRRDAESGEMVCQFALDSAEIEAWISEQELYLLTSDKPKDEHASMNSLRRHRVRAGTIDRWSKQITSLQHRGYSLCSHLETLYSQPPKPTDSHLQEHVQQIQNCLNRISQAANNMHGLVREITVRLESKQTKYRLLREVADLEAWIAEKSKVAINHELGSDLDHCSMLRDRFSNFIKLTVPDGSKRLSSVNSQCVRLITQEHPDAADIARAKDNVNEAWADLLELIDTRKQLLRSALDMHHFVNDCQDTEERITYRMENLPPVPSEALITGKKQGLSGCQRSQASLEQELNCLRDQVERLTTTNRRLLPRYAGTQAEQLQARHDRVQSAWQRLLAIAEGRTGMLDSASRIHRFLVVARELILWLEGTRDQMETKERPRDVLGVEFLIKEHTSLHSEIEARADSVESCLNLGRIILAEHPVLSTETVPARDPLAGPRAEVRERCVQLATGHLLVKELWRERWDRLHLLLEVRQFARDANTAEVWLAGKELQLEMARRQLGETISETLMLLGAHYAFQKTLVSANERFNTLKRLTTLEVRAMEWNPQESTLKEQEKRDKVREVVREFLPNYASSKPTVSTTATITQPPVTRLKTSVAPETKMTKPANSALVQKAATTEPLPKPIYPVSESTVSQQETTSVVPTERTKPTEVTKRKVSTVQMVLSRQPQPSGPVHKEGQNGSSTIHPLFTRDVLPSIQTQPEPITEQQDVPADRLSEKSGTQRQRSRQASIETPVSHSPKQLTPISSQKSASLSDESSGRLGKEKDVSSSTSSGSPESSQPSSAAGSENISPRPPVSSPSELHVAERRSEQSLTSSSSHSKRRSTVGSTELSAQIRRSPTEIAEQMVRAAPKLEGPVVRKREVDVGGSVRPRSAGRSWAPVYLVLDGGQLRVYKDYRSRREKPDEYFKNEMPISLVMATAVAAIDYAKRPCVFRLHLNDGREYLFQTANDRVLQRWMDAINEAAQIVTTAQQRASRSSIASLGPMGSRTGSLRYDSQSSMAQRRSMKSFFSLRRKS
ncbi:Spectrin beta [Fasciola hepatica]|uniref:Spectrin beta n=1 Tax=Fasciola hepatica TaxID=6192 RepID=A0A4E0S1Q9_FASHE|nr:Spectrin beta [Fasciola hepatica]